MDVTQPGGKEDDGSDTLTSLHCTSQAINEMYPPVGVASLRRSGSQPGRIFNKLIKLNDLRGQRVTLRNKVTLVALSGGHALNMLIHL